MAANPGLVALGLVLYACLWILLLRSESISVGNMSTGVMAWWTGLCAVTVFNIGGWRVAAASLAQDRAANRSAAYEARRRQLWLSAAYVFGCGFRSVLPRADVQRFGLYDSWISSVMVGRTVATVAEVCFVIQWAIALHSIARDARSRFGLAVSRSIVPLILVAEACSWYSVVTTSYLGNTIEESLWTLSAALVCVSSLRLWSRCRAECRPVLAAAVVLGAAYVAFMVLVDVPMYAGRWLADEAAGRVYLSLREGLWDVWSRRHVTFDWEEWRPELAWMACYFSVAVWCSIALIHAPVPLSDAERLTGEGDMDGDGRRPV